LLIRLLALLISLIATAALAAPGLTAGALNEFDVELPTALRNIAGRGSLSPVTHALITIAVPPKMDLARERPVLVISATSDAGSHSSRRLLRAYAETALASGWVLVAADPAESVTVEQDDVPLRLALNTAALAVMGRQWARGATAPLAFGGFSGGAKYSGWLAAAFASQGRTVIGLYLAGINQNTLLDAATQFKVLNTDFKRIPVFLQSGEQDEVATTAEHQDLAGELIRAGFKNVRIVSFPGLHEVEPGPLRIALDWFSELAALPATSR
jgi:predicted esterase